MVQFNHPMVRQLAFTIASPNLLCHLPQSLAIQHSFQLHSDLTWGQHFQNYLPRLQQLDESPEPYSSLCLALKARV